MVDPEGEYGEGDDPLAVAVREFEEELGKPTTDFSPLGEVRQPGGNSNEAPLRADDRAA